MKNMQLLNVLESYSAAHDLWFVPISRLLANSRILERSLFDKFKEYKGRLQEETRRGGHSWAKYKKRK